MAGQFECQSGAETLLLNDGDGVGAEDRKEPRDSVKQLTVTTGFGDVRSERIVVTMRSSSVLFHAKVRSCVPE